MTVNFREKEQSALCNPADYLIAGTDADVVRSYSDLAERALHARYGLIEPQIVIVDTETTGLNSDSDELIEIAAVKMDGPDVVEEFQTFVDPRRSIPEFITELTGISSSDVSGAPGPIEAVRMLDTFCEQSLLVAHNARFDRDFVGRHAKAPSDLADRSRWIDSLTLSRIALPRLIAHDQQTLCDAFGIDRGNHRAIGDVRALARLWRIMLAALGDMPNELVAFMADLAPGATWPVREALRMVVSSGSEPGRFSMHTLRDRRMGKWAREAPPLVDPAETNMFDLTPIDRAEIEEAFCSDGIVGRMYSSFERRPEQVELAMDVSEAFRTSTHSVIEAGTGVGKSISYLLPSVLFALRNRVRVGIATKTNTLLDQLVFHELPALSDAMESVTGTGFSYIALKGYDHYPCLRKLMHQARSMGDDAGEYNLMIVATILSQVAQATWGDLDALTVSLSNSMRAGVVCSAEECLHAKCSYFPRRCLLHGARRHALDSEVIVTNHALLFRDIAMDKGVLPPIRYWVVDEAHGMEDEARDQLSYSVDAGEAMTLLRKLDSQSSPVRKMQDEAMLLEGGSSLMGSTSEIRRRVPEVMGLAESFFRLVKDLGELVPRSAYSTREIWINEERRDTEQWAAVVRAGTVLIEQISTLSKWCSDAASIGEQFEELSVHVTELSSAATKLSDLLQSLSLFIDGTDSDYFYYAVVHSDKDKLAERLVAALVDPGNELSSRFFPEENSVVMTSATIAVGDSFDYFAHRVGLDRLESEMWSSRKLEPAEGFYENMRTIVVTDVPEPRDPDYLDAMERILADVHLGLGGGVLTLFTNRREMQELYSRLNPVLRDAGIELLCQQGGKSRRLLSEEFTKNEDSCLFAMRSFWEGFDAPGRTLRCVVLPKLPFSRPDDPLCQELNIRRKDAWKTFVLPQAVIDTKQAAGRLIRSRSDAGVLVLADSRLTTKWYGKVFLKSLARGGVESIPESALRASLEESGL